jgi:hypothetical protein
METDRTEITIDTTTTKTVKTVRFGTDKIYDISEVEEEEEQSVIDTKSPLEQFKAHVRRSIRRLAHGLKVAGRKCERPVIMILMRIGY